MPDREWVIRPAVSADAERVYELKRSVFGATYLPFTIFQSPKSVSYLRELIGSSGPHAIFVLEKRSEVCGYYDGIVTGETTWFLAYIAVENVWRGHGFGDALLRHFEAEGRKRDRKEAALDVFASNARAVKWYEGHGYTVAGRLGFLRTRLGRLDGRGAGGLRMPEEALRFALDEEGRRGFSKVDALWGTGRLCVGLIGGDSVRLLSCEGMSLSSAAKALAARFQGERETLILSGPEEELRSLPGENREVSLRLMKRWAA
jgi:ribosomal protein S18 acetylase RimI-like enzyme